MSAYHHVTTSSGQQNVFPWHTGYTRFPWHTVYTRFPSANSLIRRELRPTAAEAKCQFATLLLGIVMFCHVVPVHQMISACDECPRGLTFTWWEGYGVCLWHEPAQLAHSSLFCSCVYLGLYGHFNWISFHKFSLKLSVFWLCSTGLISALIGPFNYMSLYESPLQPW